MLVYNTNNNFQPNSVLTNVKDTTTTSTNTKLKQLTPANIAFLESLGFTVKQKKNDLKYI